MKHTFCKRAVAFFLALVCIMSALPLSAFAAGLSTAPSSITQKSCNYMFSGGSPVRYKAANSTVNSHGIPYVFDVQMNVPGYGTARGLCARQAGTLGGRANGQRWNFQKEITHPSLKLLLTFIYSCTYGEFTDAGKAAGQETWGPMWSNVWFVVAQALTWCNEHGVLIDYTTDKEGFIKQASEEMLAAFKMFDAVWNSSPWITNWNTVDIYTIIDSNDGGLTGYSAYDYVTTAVRMMTEHPEFYPTYHLWQYEWDSSQPWKLTGQEDTPMQRILVAVPEAGSKETSVSLKVKKLEAGTDKPIPGVTFKVESADGSGSFSVTRTTGADGTFTLTTKADNLAAGQYKITETAVPEGFKMLTESQIVTVLPNSTADSAITFYNEEEITGEGTIRKVDADNPTVGIPGAVIKITSVKLDEGGSFTGTYTTGEGGYISKEDLDFSKLPKGSYIAEEITPPKGYILSSDVSKVKQTFVWDGKTDVSLIFENSSKVKVQLKKVDESGKPVAGAIFVILRDGQIIETKETDANGTITVSNVSEGYYEFREVSVPAPYDCDSSPVGVHINAEDLQGEQTITVTKVNHHLRTLTIQKRDSETGEPVPGTSFHIRGVNLGYENDVTTGADGKAVLENMPSGCYEIEETAVPKPYILDTNNRKTVWIDSEKDKDVVVDFVNSTKPGLRLLKLDYQTGKPVPGVTFKIEEVDGGFTDQRQTDKDGVIFWENLRPGAYKVWEVSPAPNYVHDDTVHVVQLEENHTTTIELTNIKKPTLKVLKVDSITRSPIANVKFQIWRGSDNTKAGEYNDLGVYYTNANGEILLEHADTGWYKIKELEPAPGFTIKQPDTQEIYLSTGKTHTVTFENTPKNSIIVEKYDSVTHQALPGCTFQLRYLSGTSGTGGTVIGQKVTGVNGIAMWTGLDAGTYIVEEVEAADGYSIVKSSETVYLADNGEQSVVTVRFNNSPDGSLLIRKVCATNPSVTLQNAEFKVTYADGTLIGNSNGIFRSDENGEVRIDGLKPGSSVIVTEVKAPKGFIIDTQSQTIQIKEGRTVTLTFKNQPKGKLIIQKRDSQTGEALSGAEFRITTAAGCEVGLDGVIGTASLTQNGIFTTDSQGEIRISNLAPGAYVINEIKAPNGYVIDTPSTNVVIGTGGDTQTVVIKDTKKGGLIVEKYDSVTKQPLSGARFKVMMANGELTPDNEGLTSSNGLYTTNINGQIVLSKLLPGTYVVTEDKAPDNYRKDPTPQTVVVNAGDTQTLRFYDEPLCTLTILKRDAVTRKPLQGAEFTVRDSEGKAIGPNNGRYTTGTDGTAIVTGLEPNATIVVSESRAPSGYILDETPKNIVVRSGVANSLTFDNEPGTTLIIHKYIEGTENEPLSGVAFKVVDGSGAAVGPDDGVYYTDHAGEIVLDGIEPGTTVIAREIRTVEGYVLDGTPQNIKIVGGQVQQLTFWNKQAGTLVIQKKDKVSGELISGAQFQLTYANGGYVDTDNGHLSSNGIYTTGDKGEIRISGIVGTVVAKEIKAAPGYVIDSATQTQTVTVNPMDTQTLVFLNDPLCSLTVTKLDSVTGKPVPGTVFAVKDGNGNVLTTCTTGKDGTATVTGLVPGSTVVVTEVSVPDGYVLDTTPKSITVKNGTGNSVTTGGTGTGNGLTFENDPKMTLTIHKYIEGTANEPLAGVAFKVVDGSGAAVGTGDGVYYTNTEGDITVTGIEPGTTLIVREIRTVEGFVLDGTPKTVKVTAGQPAPELTFWNKRDCTLTILKQSTSKDPLSGAVFHVTDEDGAAIGTNNGRYTSDRNGLITITGLQPGQVLVVTEEKAPDGYVLDTTPKTIKIKQNVANSLIFENAKAGSLVINKRSSADKKTPLEGVTFKITTASGEFLPDENGKISSNGLYYTDENGQIVINSVVGALVVTEVATIDGYTISSANRSQTVEVKPDDTQTLYFYNDPLCSLTITKLDSVTGKPVPGTVFAVKDGSGNVLGHYITGKDGTATVVGLIPGSTVVVTEVSVPNGYVLDTTPKSIVIKNDANNSVTIGGTGTGNGLTFENDPKMTLTIHKYIEGTANEPLAGVAFKVVDGSGASVGTSDGIYYTNTEGDIKVTGIEPGTTVVVREVKTVEGFVLDGTHKTVKVTAGQPAPELTFWNKRDCSLTILKQSTSKDPLSGAVFHVTDEDGAAIGTNNGRYTSDRNGLITITGLQPGQVLIVTEEKAPDGYVRDMTPKTIKIKQDVANSLIFENAKAGSLVINKRSSADKKTPLEGVTFKITTTSGEFLPDENGKISSNGLYYTDENGQIVINSVVGTLVVTEVASIDGYTISDANRSQTVEVKPDDTQTLYFYNDPLCSLTITKLDSVTGKPVPNTQFAVKDGNGNVLATCTTGKDGTATVTGLVPGSTVVVVETKVPSGYVLNPTPQTIIVRNGSNIATTGSSSTGTTPGTTAGSGNALTFENDPKTILIIEKYVTGTTTPIKGVTFLVTDSSGAVVGSSNGEYITDENGRIVIEGLEPGATITAKEIRTVEGYVLDTTPKSIKIKTGAAQTLRFYNQKKGELIIRKLDSVTRQPLAGVEFELTYAGGGYVDNADGHLSSNGLYTTDAHGEIHISGITGTIVVKETRTIPGYIIDPATQTQTVKVNPQDTQTLTFYNAPKQTLTIQKYVDGTTTPIQGVTFLIIDSNGQFVGPNNGEYITDKNGRIVLTDLTPGTTITAKETKTVSGFVLDTTPQSILIKQGVAQTLTFFNKAAGGLELIKVSEADTTKRIANVKFEIRRMDGGLVETITTGTDGRAYVALSAGNYYAVEVECPKEYKLDNTPHYFTVQDGKTTTLTIKNKPLSAILIHKTDSTTGKGLYGVSFLLYDSNNTPIGQYTSDNQGYVYIEGLTAGGRYYLRELENPGYVPDTEMKTVYVKAGETTLIEWKNIPITAQIQITKKSADYNSTNGLPAGTLLEGAVFEIRDKAGNLVDTIKSDSRGVAASKPLPLGRYTIKEVKAPANYGINEQELTAYLEHAGEIVRFEVLDKSLTTGVSITKTGPKQAMAGQPVNYTFSNIGNNSNVRLDSFYWRDTLPAQVRLNTIVTGTYNFPGNYKIVYRTNTSNGEYRAMYDNLSTSKNYTLAASAAALKLASNEYITEIMFVFGQVPGGFAQVEKPAIYCTALSNLTVTSFTNTADVGGVYNGQWVQAISRWVTTVYKKPVVPTLPKTGY